MEEWEVVENMVEMGGMGGTQVMVLVQMVAMVVMVVIPERMEAMGGTVVQVGMAAAVKTHQEEKADKVVLDNDPELYIIFLCTKYN